MSSRKLAVENSVQVLSHNACPSERTVSSRTSIRPVFSTGTARFAITSVADQSASPATGRPSRAAHAASVAAIRWGQPQARKRIALTTPLSILAESLILTPWSEVETDSAPARPPAWGVVAKSSRTVALYGSALMLRAPVPIREACLWRPGIGPPRIRPHPRWSGDRH